MKKKILLAVLVCLCTVNTIAVSASASEIPESVSTGIVTPQTEEFEWFYRYNDQGVLQKRLWSITYGYWVTDWINV